MAPQGGGTRSAPLWVWLEPQQEISYSLAPSCASVQNNATFAPSTCKSTVTHGRTECRTMWHRSVRSCVTVLNGYASSDRLCPKDPVLVRGCVTVHHGYATTDKTVSPQATAPNGPPVRGCQTLSHGARSETRRAALWATPPGFAFGSALDSPQGCQALTSSSLCNSPERASHPGLSDSLTWCPERDSNSHTFR